MSAPLPRVVGLFAGIGGNELGLRKAGFESVLLCEVWDAALMRAYPQSGTLPHCCMVDSKFKNDPNSTGLRDRMKELAFHPLMNRRVRTGTPQEQGVSTYRLAECALDEGRFEDAIELGQHARDETWLARTVYPRWIADIREYLLGEGVRSDIVSAEEEDVLAIVPMPDGSKPDIETQWPAFSELIERFTAACRDGRPSAARALLEEARVAWVVLHDRVTDHINGLFEIVVRHLGEDRIGEVWDALMADWYPSRDEYDIDVRPWNASLEILLPDTTESLRGHMSGVSRAGDIEVIEEADRWIFRFEPCGSGGRTVKGEPTEGSGSRMEPPFNFSVTTREHDWSWGQKGICLYCVHCCQLQERVPIKKLGYPVRVVDPPIWPRDRETGLCTWSVYKHPSLIPEDVYRRVGASRPARFGGSGSRDGQSGVSGPASEDGP